MEELSTIQTISDPNESKIMITTNLKVESSIVHSTISTNYSTNHPNIINNSFNGSEIIANHDNTVNTFKLKSIITKINDNVANMTLQQYETTDIKLLNKTSFQSAPFPSNEKIMTLDKKYKNSADFSNFISQSSNATDSDDNKSNNSSLICTTSNLEQQRKNTANITLLNSFPENKSKDLTSTTKSPNLVFNPELLPLTNGLTNALPNVLTNVKFDNMKFLRENMKLNEKFKSDFTDIVSFQYIPSFKMKSQPCKGQKTNTSQATWVAKFSPNDKYLAIGGVDGILKIFDVILDVSHLGPEVGDAAYNILDPNYRSFAKHTSDIIDISWYKVIF